MRLCAAAAFFLLGCGTVGPIPGMTFATAVPRSEAGVEVTAAGVPGFFASDAVVPPPEDRTAHGGTYLGFSAFVDPGRVLGVDGLSLGARYIGGRGGLIEPLLRYRRSFGEDDLASFAVVAGGSYSIVDSPEQPDLRYRGLRGALELGGDLRLTPRHWLELHLIGGGALTALDATGRWCASLAAVAIECPNAGTSAVLVYGNARLSGLFPSGFLGLSFDVGRGWRSYFHFARLGLVIAGGRHPELRPLEPRPGITASEEQTVERARDGIWTSAGLAITLSAGMPRPAPEPVKLETDRTGTSAAPLPPRPSEPTRIKGLVRGATDATTRVPLAGAEIEAPGGLHTLAAEDGSFELANVGTGPITLRVSKEGYLTEEAVVVVVPGYSAEVDVVLRRQTLRLLASIRGHVRTERGKPIPGAVVRIVEAKVSARTSVEGAFTVRAPGGRYSIVFEAPGFVTQQRELTLPDGDQLVFEVQLVER